MDYAIPFYIGTIYFCCEKNNETIKKKKAEGRAERISLQTCGWCSEHCTSIIPILTYTPPNVSL